MPELLQILYNITALPLWVPTSLELKHCGLFSVQDIYVIFIYKLHNNNYQSFTSVLYHAKGHQLYKGLIMRSYINKQVSFDVSGFM